MRGMIRVMDIDERIAALTVNIESLYSSIKELRAVAESHNVHLESLHSNAADLHAGSQRHEELLRLLARILRRTRRIFARWHE